MDGDDDGSRLLVHVLPVVLPYQHNPLIGDPSRHLLHRHSIRVVIVLHLLVDLLRRLRLRLLGPEYACLPH